MDRDVALELIRRIRILAVPNAGCRGIRSGLHGAFPFVLNLGFAIVPPMEAPDAEIIAAVLNGDVSAFEPLVVKYQPRVFATARRYARRESEVEDIVQEVFIKAFQKLSSFRGEAPFEHWLMRVAVRTCYDFLRKHQRNRESALAELSDEEDRWLDSVASSPAGQNDDSDAARAGWAIAQPALTGGPDGDHPAGNRREISEGDRGSDRVVCVFSQSPRLPRARQDAQAPQEGFPWKVSVTCIKIGPSGSGEDREMDIKELYRKLMNAARSMPPDERTPYAFEKRVIACLQGLPKVDLARLWSRGMWRAAMSSAAVMLAILIWTRLDSPMAPAAYADGSALDIEEIVLAPLASLENEEGDW